jgi:hypothetical protein
MVVGRLWILIAGLCGERGDEGSRAERRQKLASNH